LIQALLDSPLVNRLVVKLSINNKQLVVPVIAGNGRAARDFVITTIHTLGRRDKKQTITLTICESQVAHNLM
jgi:hypothetical protein